MKKQIIVALMIVALPALFMTSCTKSSADQQTTTPPTGECDTVAMKYSVNVLPIMQAFCYGCHGNGNTGGSGGINLDGYANLQTYAKNGILKGVITHASGFPAMPYGLPKMDDCNINKIIDWINQGAPNN